MSNRIEGERVFCYSCENEWDRAHGGLQCPRCESEFVEILEPGSRPDIEDPPEVAPESPLADFDHLSPLRNHNPWWETPDPDDGDIRSVHFNGGGPAGGSNFSYTRTYTFGGGPGSTRQEAGNPHNIAQQEIMRNFESMVTGMLGPVARLRGGNFGGQININGRTTTFGSGTFDAPTFHSTMGGGGGGAGAGGPPDMMSMLFPGAGGPRSPGGTLDLFSSLFNPANARFGDAVGSQEAFDRVMSQLMEQNQQNGAPPAAEDRINSLPKKKVDKSMLGSDDKAECSICMESVVVGTEVTVLPCQHWFHFECIKSWLSEHDTCPHCRKPITPDGQQESQSQSRSSGRRRSSRRSSSVASPLTQVRGGVPAETSREGGRQDPISVPDDPSPSALRNAREQYYGRSESSRYRGSDEERDQRPSSERRNSRRSTGSGGRDEGGGGGGGVSGWLRNRFS